MSDQFVTLYIKELIEMKCDLKIVASTLSCSSFVAAKFTVTHVCSKGVAPSL